MKPISKGTVNMLYIVYTHVKIICYMQMTSDEENNCQQLKYIKSLTLYSLDIVCWKVDVNLHKQYQIRCRATIFHSIGV